ncbi:protein of unknown function [Pseudomonas inefficax]|uniref:Uncharacterized protein n=1 Tax=Pseudomonas inefficax TaxID=2078786 RepID=A0AAQ1PBA8_9PSED|nr:protein of unknown function [Pseudomonas inefficax]
MQGYGLYLLLYALLTPGKGCRTPRYASGLDTGGCCARRSSEWLAALGRVDAPTPRRYPESPFGVSREAALPAHPKG